MIQEVLTIVVVPDSTVETHDADDDFVVQRASDQARARLRDTITANADEVRARSAGTDDA